MPCNVPSNLQFLVSKPEELSSASSRESHMQIDHNRQYNLHFYSQFWCVKHAYGGLMHAFHGRMHRMFADCTYCRSWAVACLSLS